MPGTSPLKRKTHNWIKIFDLELKEQLYKAPSGLHSLRHAARCLLTGANARHQWTSLSKIPHVHRVRLRAALTAAFVEKHPHCGQKHNGFAHTENWPEACSLFLPLLLRQVTSGTGAEAGSRRLSSPQRDSTTCQDPGVSQYPLSNHAQICPVSIQVKLSGKRLPPCFVLQPINIILKLFPI